MSLILDKKTIAALLLKLTGESLVLSGPEL